jgi:hypothetical protein
MKNSEKRSRKDRNEWRALVAEWRASGERAPEFARRRGLQKSSLYYWSSVLGREPAKPPPRLVPVQVPRTEVRSMGTELVVGVVRVRFQDIPPPGYVASLARALLETGAR